MVAAPVAGTAQLPPMVVGFVGGYTATEHAWSPDTDTERVAGFTLGGFVDVQAPLSWLSAGAELAYTQRGANVLLDVGGTPSLGGIRADYLTWAIRVRAALALGPARVHVVMGPVNDIVVRSRLDPLLVQILDEEQPAPFGFSAGAGLGVWVTERLLAEVEVRVVEGLQPAYSGNFISARNRSQELVARIGLRIGP
jgi:hypothetical protein